MDSVRGVNLTAVTNALWSVPAQVGTYSPEFIPSTLLLSQLALRKGKMSSGLPAPAWVNHALARRDVSKWPFAAFSCAHADLLRSSLGGKEKKSIGKDN